MCFKKFFRKKEIDINGLIKLYGEMFKIQRYLHYVSLIIRFRRNFTGCYYIICIKTRLEINYNTIIVLNY